MSPIHDSVKLFSEPTTDRCFRFFMCLLFAVYFLLLAPAVSLGNDWQYKRKLTFDNAAQSENLIDFPVLVHLSSSNFDFSKAQGNGEDIRFFDADDTTELKYEIESWDAGGQVADIWVKVPQVDGSSSVDHIWMHYGNATASDGQDVVNVWDSNYKGVWHLDEDQSGTGTPDVYKDSTASDGNHGDDYVSATGQEGQINGGQEFDGSDDYVQTSSSELKTADEFTISIWFKADATDFAHMLLWQGDEVANGWGRSTEGVQERHIAVGGYPADNDQEIYSVV